MITKWHVPDFIATLGTFSAVRGIALLITDGLPVPDFEGAVRAARSRTSVNTLGSATRSGDPVDRDRRARLRAGRRLHPRAHEARPLRLRDRRQPGGRARVRHQVERSKVWIYMISGLFAAIAGFCSPGARAARTR